MSDSIRILSIDGGGIRGIIPAIVIQALLGDERKAQDAFHIIAGTSTGGIIACGLAKPNPMGIQDIIDLYVDHGSEIFKKGPIDLLHYIHGPRYAATALENYLAEKFGQTYLSEVKDVELLVPSYAIGLPENKPPASMFFRSWQSKGLLLGEGARHDEYDFELAAIARATSAAPTYFPPATIMNRAKQPFTMIDGGVFANNPTMCAIVEAYHLYHSRNFMVVSLGTGSEPIRIDAAAACNWGDISWAMPMMSIFQDGNSQSVAFEIDELLGDNHWRLDISLTTATPEGESVDPSMDDASPANVRALRDKARQLIDAERGRIEALAKVLAEPKASVQPRGSLPKKGFLAM
ncbi:MAG: patatin-like phospholipase family protein [Anaerolineaceae bacterium]|nr:patatin-like phospholipase family protein [Anaerolineaceae bacterium]